MNEEYRAAALFLPLDTPAAMNPIRFMKQYVTKSVELEADDVFLFSINPKKAAKTEFIYDELVAMAECAGVVVASGLKLTSHFPRRGMLTEFIFQHAWPDNIVVAGRMDWSPKASLVVTYSSRDVVRS